MKRKFYVPEMRNSVNLSNQTDNNETMGLVNIVGGGAPFAKGMSGCRKKSICLCLRLGSLRFEPLLAGVADFAG
ncbi:hypothetical protein SCA6_003760 [Theobroma cacao]